jgi:hypothetical protein
LVEPCLISRDLSDWSLQLVVEKLTETKEKMGFGLQIVLVERWCACLFALCHPFNNITKIFNILTVNDTVYFARD